ncbi:MAG TPA: hypothetical protein VK613_05700, partial [Gaiellaceae bacterium]|nr:hypothetical protein [Gaiellaceae bacterium]
MHPPLAALRRLQSDRVLAVALLTFAELEIWLTSDAGGYRVSATLVAPVVAVCVAARRRYPAVA